MNILVEAVRRSMRGGGRWSNGARNTTAVVAVKRKLKTPGALKGARRVREAARGNGPALRAGTATRADFTGPARRRS